MRKDVGVGSVSRCMQAEATSFSVHCTVESTE